MAFVTIQSLDGLTSKEFATQLANRWGVGYKGTDRGILVLLALKEREYRISVGLGLETIVSNEEVDRLGKEMVPMLPWIHQLRRARGKRLFLERGDHDQPRSSLQSNKILDRKD
jgi:hypothetical protein